MGRLELMQEIAELIDKAESGKCNKCGGTMLRTTSLVVVQAGPRVGDVQDIQNNTLATSCKCLECGKEWIVKENKNAK